MAKLLCVEDTKEFQIYLGSILKEHTLTFAGSVAEAIQVASGGGEMFDLILLDISLPDGNGMKVLPQLKEFFQARPIPIIVLSSDDDILTKVAAFGIGADDFVAKPPNPSELKARIEARLRWANSQPSRKSRLSVKDLTVDLEKMAAEITLDSGLHLALELTPFEFKILTLLIGRPGQVFSRDQIIERVWGHGKHITARTVDAHVSHLRKKLIKSAVQIDTVLSAGYKICA